MAKSFKHSWFLGAMILIAAASTVSTASPSPTSVVDQSKFEATAIYNAPSFEITTANHDFAALDHLVIEIPGGSLYHLEEVEAVMQVDPKKVLPVANSPPVTI